MGSHTQTSLKMARRSQRIKVTKTKPKNQNKTKTTKTKTTQQPAKKRTYKPKKGKTKAQITAQKFEKQKKEALKSVEKLEKSIEKSSKERNSLARFKLEKYRQEAQTIGQIPNLAGSRARIDRSRARVNEEWSKCPHNSGMDYRRMDYCSLDKSVEFFVGKKTEGPFYPRSTYLETWEVYFKAPSYSKLDFLKATVNFPIDYPFSSPIIDFSKFRYPLYDMETTPWQTMDYALRDFVGKFEDEEYFCVSNREEIVKVKWYRQSFQERFSLDPSCDFKYKTT